MKLFDVYPLFDVNIVKGKGCKVWDEQGQEYLDLYGGHAVISIGHSHPHYIEKVTEQLGKIVYRWYRAGTFHGERYRYRI